MKRNANGRTRNKKQVIEVLDLSVPPLDSNEAMSDSFLLPSCSY